LESELWNKKEVQSFLASRVGRVLLVNGAGDDCDVYADKGRAGYEDAGPGIRRLSAAVVMVVKGVEPQAMIRRISIETVIIDRHHGCRNDGGLSSAAVKSIDHV